MRKTLFNLGKKVTQTKFYGTVQLVNTADEVEVVVKLLNRFSGETQKKVSREIMQTCYNYFLKEIHNNIQKGTELITDYRKLNPLGSLEIFKKSVEIANTLLENNSVNLISNQHKCILAQAYAGYADVLRKFEPEKIDLEKEMIKKALELDPKNEIANRLCFNMNFYDIVPEPTGNKL